VRSVGHAARAAFPWRGAILPAHFFPYEITVALRRPPLWGANSGPIAPLEFPGFVDGLTLSASSGTELTRQIQASRKPLRERDVPESDTAPTVKTKPADTAVD